MELTSFKTLKYLPLLKETLIAGFLNSVVAGFVKTRRRFFPEGNDRTCEGLYAGIAKWSNATASRAVLLVGSEVRILLPAFLNKVKNL